MLSLAPPYYIYDGVSVFSDSEDPQQWYYLPNRPHFAVDEQNRPAVRFLVLKEDLEQLTSAQEDTAGFLIFDTSLAWPEATLAAVAQKIQQGSNLDTPPRLVPLLYTSGTVRLMFLDKTTPDPGAKPDAGPEIDADPTAPAAAPDQWVTMLETSGVPSMYGENRAIFSATLTKQATELLYGAFDGFIPAGVIYDLTFSGLQPAFHIHVQADWSQVFNYIKEKHTVNVIFFSSDIEKTVQSLIDNKTIVFTATIEGVGDEGLSAQFDEVRKQVMDFVMSTFFKPTPNPFLPDTAVKDGIIGVLESVRDLASPISCGYQRIELDATEVRGLTIDYDVAQAVQRNIAPQAHLELFFSDFALTRDQVVTVVNGADDFFKEADFSVLTSASYKADGIDAVTVDVAYGQPDPVPDNAPLWSFVFNDSATVAKKPAWFDPAVGDVARYRYEVVFDDSVAGPEIKLDSGWQDSRGMVVMVTPEELYVGRRVSFTLDSLLDPKIYSEVQVELRYTDTASSWSHQDSSLLTQTSRTWSTAFRIHRAWDPTIEYRLTYFHAAGNTVVEWQPTLETDVPVTDPRANLYPVNVVVAGDRSQLSNVVIQLSYSDDHNAIYESATFNLNSTTFDAPHTWQFPRAVPANNRYIYNAVIVDTTGNALQTGDVQADDSVLLIGPAQALSWRVKPELVGPPLEDNAVQSISLMLLYEDGSNPPQTKTMALMAPGPAEMWLLRLADPSKRQFTYTVTYTLTSGFDRVLGPLAATDTFLSLSSIPPVS